MSAEDHNSKAQSRNASMQTLLDRMIDLHVQRISQIACSECGARAASAQDVANAAKFLKENGFTIDPVKENDALDDLSAKMQQKIPTTRPTTPTFPPIHDEDSSRPN
jgi:hypothetical protein